MRRHRSLSYVLAGSKRTLIEAMVGSKGRALWKLAEPMEFGMIDDDARRRPGSRKTRQKRVAIGVDAATLIVGLAKPRTRDIVSWRAWCGTPRSGACSFTDHAHAAMDRLVRDHAALYGRSGSGSTHDNRWCCARWPRTRSPQITASRTLRTYRLGAKSTAQSAIDGDRGGASDADHARTLRV